MWGSKGLQWNFGWIPDFLCLDIPVRISMPVHICFWVTETFRGAYITLVTVDEIWKDLEIIGNGRYIVEYLTQSYLGQPLVMEASPSYPCYHLKWLCHYCKGFSSLLPCQESSASKYGSPGLCFFHWSCWLPVMPTPTNSVNTGYIGCSQRW